jgi:hypothetical protein
MGSTPVRPTLIDQRNERGATVDSATAMKLANGDTALAASLYDYGHAERRIRAALVDLGRHTDEVHRQLAAGAQIGGFQNAGTSLANLAEEIGRRNVLHEFIRHAGIDPATLVTEEG